MVFGTFVLLFFHSRETIQCNPVRFTDKETQLQRGEKKQKHRTQTNIGSGAGKLPAQSGSPEVSQLQRPVGSAGRKAKWVKIIPRFTDT